MSVTTKRKRYYFDFTKENRVPINSAAGAVAAASNTQVDHCWVGGTRQLEWYQSGASGFATPTIAATGWCMPCAKVAGGIQITQGVLHSQANAFTVGTDPAFYTKLRMTVGTIAEHVGYAVGFRTIGTAGAAVTYVAATNEATLLAAYDDKALVGIFANAGATKSVTSIGGSDVTTAATLAAVAATNEYTAQVNVSAAGVVTFKVASAVAGTEPTLAADVALSVPAFTFASGTIVVPTIAIVNANNAAANDDIIKSWEFGYSS